MYLTHTFFWLHCVVIKKAERWRIDAFELWCWRFLRVPWTARRSNQSVLKEINPEYSLEGLMLKLKLQYFGHQIWRANSLEKTVGKLEGRRRRWWQRMRWSDGIIEFEFEQAHHWHEFEQTRGDSKGQGSLACCSPWCWNESDMTEKLNHNNKKCNIKNIQFSQKVAKVLELQLQHQSFQWIIRIDFL